MGKLGLTCIHTTVNGVAVKETRVSHDQYLRVTLEWPARLRPSLQGSARHSL